VVSTLLHLSCFYYLHFHFKLCRVAQVAELRAQLEAVAQKQSMLPTASHTISTEIVVRPAGEHGRNWNLCNILAEYDISRSQYKHMLVSDTTFVFYGPTSNLTRYLI
jgi:hypothetical protein